MRADRLMAIVLLLQRYGIQTVPQLAKRLEVSERTILRDMDALSSSGVPVYAERGSRGGFRLADGYRLDLKGLNSPEVRTLFLHRLDGVLSDLGWHHDAETARVKIASAVSAEQMAHAEEVSQRFYVDESKWFEKPAHSPFLRILQDAVWGTFRIQLTYGKSSGEISSRVVSPLALVAKAGVWYLVAQREEEFRVYRVNRISNVVLQVQTFDRPKSFDLREFWNSWTRRFMENLPRYEVVLWIDRESYESFVKQSSFPMKQIDANAPDGYIAIQVVYETLEMARNHILGHQYDVVVVQPMELREAVIQRANRILSLMAGPSFGRGILIEES